MNLLKHLGGSHYNGDPNTWMPDIWGFLIFNYDIKSVVDIGCGIGVNISWFQSMGLEVTGIEADPTAVSQTLIPNNLIVHDFAEKEINLNKKIDLAISTEFVEHVESVYEENWLKILDNCNYFLMSHALPGQKGYHHVNCQFPEYWIDRVTKRNFIYEENMSLKFRQSIQRYPTKWGRNTLLFFSKHEST